MKFDKICLLAATLALASPALAELPRGKAAPPFRLKTTDGRTVSLAGLRGRTVFLDFGGPG